MPAGYVIDDDDEVVRDLTMCKLFEDDEVTFIEKMHHIKHVTERAMLRGIQVDEHFDVSWRKFADAFVEVSYIPAAVLAEAKLFYAGAIRH